MERLFQKNGYRWRRRDQRGAKARPPPRKMFGRSDANGDGVLTESEFTAQAGGKQLVADQRQKLDARRAKRFAAMDKDGDGKVSGPRILLRRRSSASRPPTPTATAASPRRNYAR
jgi:hypothetical protein